MIRLAVTALLLLSASPALGAECVWRAEDGSVLQAVDLPDYNLAYQPMGEWGTLCVVLRNAEQTTMSCDNGLEAEFARDGTDAFVDGVRLHLTCD